MNASGATPPTATVFDALLSTGLSAADADSELSMAMGKSPLMARCRSPLVAR